MVGMVGIQAADSKQSYNESDWIVNANQLNVGQTQSQSQSVSHLTHWLSLSEWASNDSIIVWLWVTESVTQLVAWCCPIQ